MTTTDSKYKHKPSEKHTLEEVLKSLQDLIRNDLLDKDQSAASAETPHVASTQSKEKPDHDHIAQTREDFAPTTTTGPVNLDAVMRSLKDLIGNELNVGDELVPTETTPAIPASEQQDAVASASEALPSPDEELNLGAPEEFIIGTEAAYSEDSIAPPPEPPVVKETAPEEFIPLDEELTLDESAEIATPSPAVSAIPDLPGEIAPELLSEPEVAAPLEAYQPEPENKTAPGIQQELLLDEPPLSVFEYKPATINIVPKIDLGPDTAPALAEIAPEIVNGPLAENANKISEETLPTIEVEETFDTGAYFETETRQTEPPPSEAQEIQEIIASALDTPRATDNLLPAPTSPSSDTQSKNLAPVPEPDKAPADKAIKLEILKEPATETDQNATSVDFDTIDINLPYAGPGPSSLTVETPALTDAAAPAAVEPPAALEAASESETRVQALPPPEAKVETKPEPEPSAVPDNMDAPLPPGETHNKASETVPTKTKAIFNLDDIPVLNEVVAPPAGSTLVAEPASPAAGPPLPAPDRARDIVVRAVAKLNVEMRKTGGAGLDTKTILRLQQLIRQELEKDGEKS